jgi:hypothetical protein
MKNNTRKMKGSGKRRREEEVPEIESMLKSNVNVFQEGADDIIETFMDFIISLNNMDDKLILDLANQKNDKKIKETSKKRDDIAIIKMNIAIKLLEAFGSKSKKASVFDDDLAKILGSLKI